MLRNIFSKVIYMVQGFCLRCKAKVEVKDPKEVVKDTKRGKRKFLVGKCPKCSTEIWKAVGKA
jgi:uncharacterized protein with PIN domain